MREKHAIRFLVCALGLAAVIFFEYGESFLFYFVGDEFAFIEFALNEKTRTLWD